MTQDIDELSSYRILDTEPEASYDDLILLARLICEAPIATITFIDEHRQWFKAVSGLDFCETPIAQSICALTVQQPYLLVISDLREDRRTHGMDIVTREPFVRFYAGAPLLTPAGSRLGTICVMDTKPRTLSFNQSLSLEALARQVVVNLQLRKARNGG